MDSVKFDSMEEANASIKEPYKLGDNLAANIELVDNIVEATLGAFGGTEVKREHVEEFNLFSGFRVREDLSSIEAKDQRFSVFWSNFDAEIGGINDDEAKEIDPIIKPFLPKPITAIADHDATSNNILPNFYLYDIEKGVPVALEAKIKVRNDHTQSGYLLTDKRRYIISRANEELSSIFVAKYQYILFALIKYGKTVLTPEFFEIWIKPWKFMLRRLQLTSLRRGKYVSPVFTSGDTITAWSTDAYWLKICTVMINYGFAVLCNIDAIRMDVLILKYFAEVATWLSLDPLNHVIKLKQFSSKIMLNSGSAQPMFKGKKHPGLPEPYSFWRFGPLTAHRHLAYCHRDPNDYRNCYATYSKSRICLKCDLSKKIEMQRYAKNDVVKEAYADIKAIAEYPLVHTLRMAQILEPLIYNASQTIYTMAWNVPVGWNGYNTTNKVLDVQKSIATANADNKERLKCKNEEDERTRAIFQDYLFDSARQLAKHAINNGFVLPPENFRATIINELTGNSAALGTMKVEIDGERISLTDKRSFTLLLGSSIFRIKSDEVETEEYSDWAKRIYRAIEDGEIWIEENKDIDLDHPLLMAAPYKLRQAIIQFRQVPGSKPTRAIYLQFLKLFIVEVGCCGFVKMLNNRPHAPTNRDQEQVWQPWINEVDWGNSNVKPEISNTDDMVAWEVEATTDPDIAVLFSDFDHFDLSEAFSLFLAIFFAGYIQGLRENCSPDMLRPYIWLDDKPLNFIEMTEFYRDTIQSRFYYAKSGPLVIQFLVYWLTSGTKGTFDINSVVNESYQRTVELKMKELLRHLNAKMMGTRIAGDDQCTLMDISSAKIEDGQRLAEIMDQVANAVGLKVNVKKSGVSGTQFEFAKQMGMLGSVLRIGAVQPATSERRTQTETVVSKIRGFYQTATMFAIRNPGEISVTRNIFWIVGCLAYALDTTGKKFGGSVRELFFPTAGIHVVPAFFSGGAGMSYSGIMNGEVALFWYSDARALFKMYCALAYKIEYKLIDAVKTKIQNALVQGLDGTTKLEVRTPDGLSDSNSLTRGSEILRLDKVRETQANKALRGLLSRGYKISDKLRYSNAVSTTLEQIVQSLNLDSKRLIQDAEAIASSFKFTSSDIKTVTNIIEREQPMLAKLKLVIGNDFGISNRQELHRYPTCCDGIFKAFQLIGCRERLPSPRSTDLLREFTAVITAAKRQGILFSPYVTAENLSEQFLAVFIQTKSRDFTKSAILEDMLTAIFGPLVGVNILVKNILQSFKRFNAKNLPYSLTGSLLVYCDLTPENLKRFSNIGDAANFNQAQVMCAYLVLCLCSLGLPYGRVDVTNKDLTMLKASFSPIAKFAARNTFSERGLNRCPDMNDVW